MTTDPLTDGLRRAYPHADRRGLELMLNGARWAIANPPTPTADPAWNPQPDDQVFADLTRAQAKAIQRALTSRRAWYETQLASGIYGTRLPGQEPVSYAEQVQLITEAQGAMVLAVNDPGSHRA